MILNGVKLLAKVGIAGGAGTIAADGFDLIDLSESTTVRSTRTALTTLSIIADYKKSLHNVSQEDYEAEQSKVHKRSANKLLKLVWKNRGTYVKVGQHLGGMDYLLPKEYTETLKVLHSSAPQSSVEDIKKVLCDELKINSVEEVFSSFEETPLGTASLAQVHKATLKDTNQVVAVKVQHPKVKKYSDQDMDMMEKALKQVLRFFPEFELMWLSEETRENLPIELNFKNEVDNCLQATENLKNISWVKLPTMYTEHCSERVLTMEYMEGGQVNDDKYLRDNNIDYEQISRKLGKLFSEMIFVHGFVHSDPHPGNILVRRKSPQQEDDRSWLSKLFRGSPKSDLEIVLLDHGLYRKLSKQFRYNYANLWYSIIERDTPGIEKWARELGSADLYPLLATIVTGRSWEVVNDKGIKNVKFTKEEDKQMRDGVGDFLVEIASVLNRIPREMLLVLKTNDHLRGLEHAHGVRGSHSGFLDMSACCLRCLNEFNVEGAKYSSWREYVTDDLPRIFSVKIKLLGLSLLDFYMWLTTGNKKVEENNKEVEEIKINKFYYGKVTTEV